ncbi:hypothetical protein CLF_105994 [Clonorchis sinensis]|uniref:Uncharacterized protein n=1 Tax=Clonorchis sinensis TaxID=79923 RepID=G7YEI1_CLOSI|nr:hypothetical protein CLF_105994 [Clonorchis sinensis]
MAHELRAITSSKQTASSVHYPCALQDRLFRIENEEGIFQEVLPSDKQAAQALVLKIVVTKRLDLTVVWRFVYLGDSLSYTAGCPRDTVSHTSRVVLLAAYSRAETSCQRNNQRPKWLPDMQKSRTFGPLSTALRTATQLATCSFQGWRWASQSVPVWLLASCILHRLTVACEPLIRENQAGFPPGRGCVDHTPSEALLVSDGVSVLLMRLLENGYLVVRQVLQYGKTFSTTNDDGKAMCYGCRNTIYRDEYCPPCLLQNGANREVDNNHRSAVEAFLLAQKTLRNLRIAKTEMVLTSGNLHKLPQLGSPFGKTAVAGATELTRKGIHASLSDTSNAFKTAMVNHSLRGGHVSGPQIRIDRTVAKLMPFRRHIRRNATLSFPILEVLSSFASPPEITQLHYHIDHSVCKHGGDEDDVFCVLENDGNDLNTRVLKAFQLLPWHLISEEFEKCRTFFAGHHFLYGSFPNCQYTLTSPKVCELRVASAISNNNAGLVALADMRHNRLQLHAPHTLSHAHNWSQTVTNFCEPYCAKRLRVGTLNAAKRTERRELKNDLSVCGRVGRVNRRHCS